MQFDFGQNWQEFSQKVLTQEKVQQAKRDFTNLMDGIDLKGKSFLDIGFGQGLSLLTALEKGAIAVGNDINPKCDEVLRHNASYFSGVRISDSQIVLGSILDDSIVAKLMIKSPNGKGYDIVHSWGVLHHTGDMKKALVHAGLLVKEGGHLVLAIYNKHWTSPVWLAMKRLYCMSSPSFQKMMLKTVAPVIWLAKFCVTRKDPREQTRGMDFYYNVVDWVGGYPYEYASAREVDRVVGGLGFSRVKAFPSEVPTGCNELVYVRCSPRGQALAQAVDMGKAYKALNSGGVAHSI